MSYNFQVHATQERYPFLFSTLSTTQSQCPKLARYFCISVKHSGTEAGINFQESNTLLWLLTTTDTNIHFLTHQREVEIVVKQNSYFPQCYILKIHFDALMVSAKKSLWGKVPIGDIMADSVTVA